MEASEPADMEELSRGLRSAICPPEGRQLIVGDWSSIEACALPWLAATPDTKDKLDALRAGEDIYCQKFTGWEGDDRQIHKVIELSLGYGGAAGAFKAMAGNYGLTGLRDHEIEAMVKKWRGANPWAVRFWNACERAATEAVMKPGTFHNAGRLQYVAQRRGDSTNLYCVLPDKTLLTYPEVTAHPELSSLRATAAPAKGKKEWPRVSLWRGLLAENATQAVCAALLRDLLRRLTVDYHKELSVVAHVHDEVIVEPTGSTTKRVLKIVRREMQQPPAWATSLPLRAKPVAMSRYGKEK
jgi:DNA polymerase